MTASLHACGKSALLTEGPGGPGERLDRRRTAGLQTGLFADCLSFVALTPNLIVSTIGSHPTKRIRG